MSLTIVGGGEWLAYLYLQNAKTNIDHKREDLEALGSDGLRVYALLGKDACGIVAALDELGTAVTGLREMIRHFEDFHADGENCGARDETDFRLRLITDSVTKCKDYVTRIKLGLEGNDDFLQQFLERFPYNETFWPQIRQDFRQKARADERGQDTIEGFLYVLFEYLPGVENCLHQIYFGIEQAATRNQNTRVDTERPE